MSDEYEDTSDEPDPRRHWWVLGMGVIGGIEVVVMVGQVEYIGHDE